MKKDDGVARPQHKSCSNGKHKRDAQTLQNRARTSKLGEAVFFLPCAGPWMTRVVHMLPPTANRMSTGTASGETWPSKSAIQAHARRDVDAFRESRHSP